MGQKEKVKAQFVTVSAEVSLNSDKGPRLHFHLFLNCIQSKNARLELKQNWKLFNIDGVEPGHVSPNHFDCGVTGSIRMQQGHYNLQFPKLGKVLHVSNHEAFKDFVPRKKWITTQFQLGKMSRDGYKKEVLRLKEGTGAILNEITNQENLERSSSIKQALDAIEEAFKRNMLPSIPWPPVVKEFMEQFRPCNFGVLGRTKPLVLNGPTRFGKSVFAENLFGAGDTLVINCQGLTVPPMRRYAQNWEKIKAIVFEEADWRLVTNNKLLFQVSRKIIDMGLSPTEQHVYSILVYFKAMILTSNQFMLGASAEAQDYLRENIFYYEVTDYLYQWPSSTSEPKESAGMMDDAACKPEPFARSTT